MTAPRRCYSGWPQSHPRRKTPNTPKGRVRCAPGDQEVPAKESIPLQRRQCRASGVMAEVGGGGAFWQAAAHQVAEHFQSPRPQCAARSTIVITGTSIVCVSRGRGCCLGNKVLVNTSCCSREGLSWLGPRIPSGVGGQPGRGRAPPSIYGGKGGDSCAHSPLLVGPVDLPSEPDPTDLSLT